MIEQTINLSKGIAIVESKSALCAEDFVALSGVVDAHLLESHEKLKRASRTFAFCA